MTQEILPPASPENEGGRQIDLKKHFRTTLLAAVVLTGALGDQLHGATAYGDDDRTGSTAVEENKSRFRSIKEYPVGGSARILSAAPDGAKVEWTPDETLQNAGITLTDKEAVIQSLPEGEHILNMIITRDNGKVCEWEFVVIGQ